MRDENCLTIDSTHTDTLCVCICCEVRRGTAQPLTFSLSLFRLFVPARQYDIKMTPSLEDITENLKRLVENISSSQDHYKKDLMKETHELKRNVQMIKEVCFDFVIGLKFTFGFHCLAKHLPGPDDQLAAIAATVLAYRSLAR